MNADQILVIDQEKGVRRDTHQSLMTQGGVQR